MFMPRENTLAGDEEIKVIMKWRSSSDKLVAGDRPKVAKVTVKVNLKELALKKN